MKTENKKHKLNIENRTTETLMSVKLLGISKDNELKLDDDISDSRRKI